MAAPGLPHVESRVIDTPHFSALAVKGAPSALTAFALLWIGAGALWVFAERIGSAQGFSLTQIGSYLAIGQVVGVAGPVMAARFGERAGLRTSIAAGSAVMAAGGLLMVYGASHATYIAGVTLLSIAVMFLTPCFRTFMAHLDVTGGVVALSAAFYTLGFGPRPCWWDGSSRRARVMRPWPGWQAKRCLRCERRTWVYRTRSASLTCPVRHRS